MQYAMKSLNLTSLFDCAIAFAKEQNLILHDALNVDAHKMIPVDVITTDPYNANTPILFFTVRAY